MFQGDARYTFFVTVSAEMAAPFLAARSATPLGDDCHKRRNPRCSENFAVRLPFAAGSNGDSGRIARSATVVP
jgi:hypothetical protein